MDRDQASLALSLLFRARRPLQRVVFSLLPPLALILAAPAAGEEVNFGKDVWPIIQDRCLECHGPEMKMGKLRLDSPEQIQKGGENGQIMVPGSPEESTLFKRIMLPIDDFDIMPNEGDPLTPEQIEVFKKWIEQGANFNGWDVVTADSGE